MPSGESLNALLTFHHSSGGEPDRAEEAVSCESTTSNSGRDYSKNWSYRSGYIWKQGCRVDY